MKSNTNSVSVGVVAREGAVVALLEMLTVCNEQAVKDDRSEQPLGRAESSSEQKPSRRLGVAPSCMQYTVRSTWPFCTTAH